MRSGLIINPQDLSKRWIDRMADNGLNVLGIHSDGGKLAYKHLEELDRMLDTREWRDLVDYAKARGVSIEYELHAVGYLVPRELYGEHPEYFRMNANGERVCDWNFCISNPDAMKLCTERAVKLASRLYGSEHNFYFWMDDGLNTHCQCSECKKYTPSEQQTIVTNAMLKEIKKIFSDARMPYLAYLDCIAPPIKVKPDPGVFLEYAPFKKYTAVSEAEKERQKEEREMLKPLVRAFGSEPMKVLEYWYDNSIFSGRVRPPKKFTLDAENMRKDVLNYAELGFKSVTSFACFLGDDYHELWGEVDVKPYAEAIREAEEKFGI